MIEIYTHELAGESSEDLLLAYGIDVKNKNAATATTINDKGENKAAEASSSSSLHPQGMPALQRAKQANFKILCQLSDGIDI
jgi:hypothetical protein